MIVPEKWATRRGNWDSELIWLGISGLRGCPPTLSFHVSVESRPLINYRGLRR